jgi:hypothetical protein
MWKLEEAAVISDNKTLSHKNTFWSKNQSSISKKSSDSDEKSVSVSIYQYIQFTVTIQQWFYFHGLVILKDSWGSGVGSFPTCTYCKKKRSSFKLKRKHNLEKPQLHACSTFINDRKAFDLSCFGTPDVQGRSNVQFSLMQWGII